MSLLSELTIYGETYRISNEDKSLLHFWDGRADKTIPVYNDLESDHGGMVRIGFGTLTISPAFFRENNIWPPPVQAGIRLLYTDTTEEIAQELACGTLHRRTFDTEEITYSVRETVWPQQLLEEGQDYGGNDVVFPRAFGRVDYVVPIRVADTAAGTPCYHKGHLAGEFANEITSTSTGSATVTVTMAAAHGWVNGATVWIDDTGEKHDGLHAIFNASGNTFQISSVSSATSYTGWAWRTAEPVIRVYVRGIPYTGGGPFTDNGDGTFSPAVAAVDEVEISGWGESTTLNEIFTWGAGQLGLTVDTASAATPGRTINSWQTSQADLMDFLSEAASWDCHMFQVNESAGTLIVVDMFGSRGETITQDGYDQLDVKYTVMSSNPTAEIAAEWTVREFKNDEEAGKRVEDVDREVTVNMVTLASGINTATGALQLIDSGASFLEAAKPGMAVRNVTGNVDTVVATVLSGTAVTLATNAFTDVDQAYRVGWKFPYGQEQTVTPLHDETDVVRAALDRIMTLIHRDCFEIKIPLQQPIPQIGQIVTWTDEQLELPIECSMQINSIRINPNIPNEEITLFGHGIMTAAT